MAQRDYYEVLGVERGVSADEIRRAYRKLARKYHPDVSDTEDAATRFAELQEAYDVLSDAEKRKAYDRFGHAGVGVGQAGPGPGGFGGGPWSGGFGGGGGQQVDPSEFASVFEELFGRAGGGPYGGRPGPGPGPGPSTRHAPPQRGRDVHHELTVSFMTAALGGEDSVRVTRGDDTRTINVKIPPGVDTGAQLRIKGQGDPGPGGQPGDLMLRINVGAHPYFKREGLDLAIDVPVTIVEATDGATVEVPLLQGTVELKVPPGSSSGQRLRVKGQGITDAKGTKGNFYAVIQIAAPGDLSARGREILAELGTELKNPRDSAPWAADLKRSKG